MINEINSAFFKRIVFSILPTSKLFKIIKYNKNLQNLLNVNIVDFMSFSGRYVIYEKNGFGKEYNSCNDKLIYEGEYLHGERNGKGVEYYHRRPEKLFEGEFKNGKRHGKGIEYNRIGDIIFEGEYKYGKKWNGIGNKYDNRKYYEIINGKGKVIESNVSGTMFYVGEFMNGERNGKGKEYLLNILDFEGIYKNGKRWEGNAYDFMGQILYKLKDGKGKDIFKYDNNNYMGYEYEYNGNYLNGEKSGKAEERCIQTNITYEGKFLNGKRDGKGEEYYDDDLIFKGKFLYNNRRKGEEYLNGKLEYKGEYLFDKKWNGVGYDSKGEKIYEIIKGNGNVKEYSPNGTLIFEGELINGKKAKGKEYFQKNGNIKFEGEYLNGKKWNGIGYDLNKNRKIKYKIKNGNGYIYEYDNNLARLTIEGEYINGEINGKGKEYDEYNDKLVYEGEFKNGKRNGKGVAKEFYKASFYYEGQYMNNLKDGYGKEYFYNKLIYEGEYKEGRRHGKGKEYYINGKLKFDGEYFNDEIWNGIIYEKDSNDAFRINSGNGYIKNYNILGNLIFEGFYKNGKKMDMGRNIIIIMKLFTKVNS